MDAKQYVFIKGVDSCYDKFNRETKLSI